MVIRSLCCNFALNNPLTIYPIMIDFSKLAEQYKHELLDQVIPFWMNHSIDTQFGGFLHCLERDGSVFDTDKFVWMQGREVWMLSKLYNTVHEPTVSAETRQQWLDAAIQGAEFLKSKAHDGNLNFYFSQIGRASCRERV